MHLRDALVAAVGHDVRLQFLDGDELYCLLRAVDSDHVLVRARGQRHPVRIGIALLQGVIVLEHAAGSP